MIGGVTVGEQHAAMLADSLESMGHEVRVAHDGRAALDAAAVFHPDVAVLDIGLPEMSGYDLAAHLRELPGGRAIRVVAASPPSVVQRARAGTDARILPRSHGGAFG